MASPLTSQASNSPRLLSSTYLSPSTSTSNPSFPVSQAASAASTPCASASEPIDSTPSVSSSESAATTTTTTSTSSTTSTTQEHENPVRRLFTFNYNSDHKFQVTDRWNGKITQRNRFEDSSFTARSHSIWLSPHCPDNSSWITFWPELYSYLEKNTNCVPVWVPASGDCMFHAVALSYASVHDESRIFSHEFLRYVVSEQWNVVSSQSKQFTSTEIQHLEMLLWETPLFTSHVIEETDSSTPTFFSPRRGERNDEAAKLRALSMEEQIKARAKEVVSKPGEYGIELELSMLAFYFDVHIDVFTWNGELKQIRNSHGISAEGASNGKTRLQVAMNGVHYFAIVDKHSKVYEIIESNSTNRRGNSYILK